MIGKGFFPSLGFGNKDDTSASQQQYQMIDSVNEDGDIEETIGENESLINRTRDSAKSLGSSMGMKLEGVTGEMTKKIEEKTGSLSQPNYLWMAIFFGVGCLFLMAAMTALPFFLLSPSGFNTYFSLASTCMLISVSFFYGPLVYAKKLFQRENLLISIIYSASTIASLSTIFVKAGYLYSIALAILQVVSLAFFVLQVVSGGENAQDRL